MSFRLLTLRREGLLSLQQATYVVVDEADLMISPGRWLDQVRAILCLVHRDRQLLLDSETWSSQLQEAANELYLESQELVRLTVFL